MMNFEELEVKVLKWADERGLLKEDNCKSQALKMVSEVGELCDSLIKDHDKDIDDAIGDVLVTLIILSKQLHRKPVGCLKLAYDEIANRKGATVGGVFIKETYK